MATVTLARAIFVSIPNYYESTDLMLPSSPLKLMFESIVHGTVVENVFLIELRVFHNGITNEAQRVFFL